MHIAQLMHAGTDGIITAETPNPAVPVEILQSVHFWLQEGCSMESVIFRLRQRTGTVTPGAGPKYTWNPGIYMSYGSSIIVCLHACMMQNYTLC